MPWFEILTPEFTSLIHCAATSLGTNHGTGRGTLIFPTIDWGSLFVTASDQGVASMLCWQLKADNWEGVPTSVREDFQKHLAENAQLNFRHASELLAILDWFAAEHISALPLRNGALMAWSLYGNLGLRDYEEAGILVHDEHFRAACLALESHGYRSIQSSSVPSMARLNRSYVSHDRLMAVKICGSAFLWRTGIHIDPELFWRDIRPMPLGGHVVQMLNPELRLFLMCVSADPARMKLGRLCDIAVLIRTNTDLNWRTVVDLAAMSSLQDRLRCSLQACSLLGVSVSPGMGGPPGRGGRSSSELFNADRPVRRKMLAAFQPTPLEMAQQMVALAEVTPNDVVFDLGCGDGRLVILAAERFGAQGVGLDIDPQRIAEAKACVRDQGVAHRTRFLLEDATVADLSEATVVLVSLTFLSNLTLRRKLQRELRPGTRVVSWRFGMADWVPDASETCTLTDGTSERLMLWRIKNDGDA